MPGEPMYDATYALTHLLRTLAVTNPTGVKFDATTAFSAALRNEAAGVPFPSVVPAALLKPASVVPAVAAVTYQSEKPKGHKK